MALSKAAVFLGTLCLAGSLFAQQAGICPSLSSIQAEGLSMAEEIGTDLYLSYHLSQYGTDATWGFVIAPLAAEDAEIAIDMANDIVRSMTAPGVPEFHEQAIICDYETGHKGILAAAINDGESISPLRLKHFLRRMR